MTSIQKNTYVVTGATGHVGGPVARGLLDVGHEVRTVGRNRARLDALVERGATPAVGDVRDGAFVEEAFRGADAALLVSPPNLNARDLRRQFGEIGDVYAAAAAATGLGQAVFVSTTGAHEERHRGLIQVHTDVEHALDDVEGLDVLHLRAPNYFENLFYFLPAMRLRGVLSTPLGPDTPFDTVWTGDVAAVALRRLHALDIESRETMEMHGPEGLTMRRIAGIIGEAIGRPFPVEQVAHETDIEAMVGMGLGRDFSTLLNDTWGIFNRHGLLRTAEPTAATRAPTPIEAFIREALVPAIQASTSTPEPRAEELAV